MIAIILAGVAPGLALLSYFYLRDKYEPEPLSMVIRTFIFGALLIFPISFVEYIFETENIIRQEMVHFLFSSGILEEISKWLVLFFIAYRNAEFDEPFDGIVYGVSVSLGFATTENVFYLVANGIEHAVARALLPVSSHALFGVIMGFYLGKAKFTEGNKIKWVLLSLLLPFILHGFYDYILITQEHWMYIIFPFMIFLWWFGLRKVKMAKILSSNHLKKQYPVQKTIHS